MCLSLKTGAPLSFCAENRPFTCRNKQPSLSHYCRSDSSLKNFTAVPSLSLLPPLMNLTFHHACSKFHLKVPLCISGKRRLLDSSDLILHVPRPAATGTRCDLALGMHGQHAGTALRPACNIHSNNEQSTCVRLIAGPCGMKMVWSPRRQGARSQGPSPYLPRLLPRQGLLCQLSKALRWCARLGHLAMIFRDEYYADTNVNTNDVHTIDAIHKIGDRGTRLLPSLVSDPIPAQPHYCTAAVAGKPPFRKLLQVPVSRHWWLR